MMAGPGRHMAIMLGACALCTTATTTAAAPAASSHAPRAVTRQSDPVLVDCLWHPDMRPEGFVLACGDGNSRLVEMRWAQWGPSSATAVGVNVVNDCKPYCAAGTFRGYPVMVRLDRPEPWKKDPRVQHFTRMSLTYTDTRPDGFTRVMTFPLWD